MKVRKIIGTKTTDVIKSGRIISHLKKILLVYYDQQISAANIEEVKPPLELTTPAKAVNIYSLSREGQMRR